MFYSAEILLCYTSRDELTVTYDDNYDGNTPEEVFFDPAMSLSWTFGQWHGFPLSSPFDYNGTDNLIVEFRWQGDTGTDVYVKGWFPPGGNRVLDGFSLTNPQGTLRSYMNALRIYYSQEIQESDIRIHIPGFRMEVIPDPFHDDAEICYTLPLEGHVSLSMYDAAGRELATLVDGVQPAGEHRLRWHPVDRGPGVYLYHLEAPGVRATGRLVHVP
jgi:hypothetical protein